MSDFSRETPSLVTVEACNALKAEGFRKLEDDIDLWRFREVLTKLGTYLGLSSGAVVYALDLMGMLTEADWRGDGRAVTYHSVRAYARKVGKSERTICEYERQLVMAGLVHRTLKHARRHGGYGNSRRRTGLDWRCFGARMPELLDSLAARQAHEERRLDLEARIRTERRIVMGLMDALEEGRAGRLLEQLKTMGVLRLRGTIAVSTLETRLAALTLLREAVLAEMPVPVPLDNSPIDAQTAGQSDSLSGLIDDTDNSSCPTDIRCSREDHTAIPKSVVITRNRKSPEIGHGAIDGIPLSQIWSAAPDSWKTALGADVEVTWPVLIELAGHLAPRLQVSAYAWSSALRVLGPSGAAMALMVLDRNRSHPKRPVLSVGGALVGMVRRAEQGDFNLAPSLHGVIGRAKAGLPGRRSAA